MPETLVSVIVPVLNGERYIERTLESARRQTHHVLEIVVVDDGSTDLTAEIVETMAQRDNRIRFFRKPHSGLSSTRNFAIAQAAGEFIAPLDADDLWHPEKIARQIEMIQAASPKIGVVYCWSVDIDEYDFIIPPIRDKCIAQGDVIVELAARNNFLENASVPLIRRSYLDLVGGYDPSLVKGSEDWKLYLALAEICHFGVVPKHLVGYRRSSSSMSRNTAAMAQSIDQVEQWILEKWPSLSKKVLRQMFGNSNRYLAHKALTGNDFAGAAYYQFKSVRADPTSLLARSTPIFAARFLARLLGLRRADIPSKSRIPFKAFQSGLQ
jgi:glycosyltransferase involved in cell wall biosynthesis